MVTAPSVSGPLHGSPSLSDELKGLSSAGGIQLGSHCSWVWVGSSLCLFWGEIVGPAKLAPTLEIHMLPQSKNSIKLYRVDTGAGRGRGRGLPSSGQRAERRETFNAHHRDPPSLLYGYALLTFSPPPWMPPPPAPRPRPQWRKPCLSCPKLGISDLSVLPWTGKASERESAEII